MSAEKISRLLGRVLGEIKNKQGLDPSLLSDVCSVKERDAINAIRIFKSKIYIYVKSNGVLYSFKLKQDKIIKILKKKTGENVIGVVFKIGEFNGS